MLELKNIYKTYRTKDGVTHRALNNISLSFEEKGLVFIVGKSGGGKTTLLNIIGALDSAEKGEILLFGNSFSTFKRSDYDKYRNTFVGVIYQEYNLLPTLSVRENIAISMRLQNGYDANRVDEIMDVLKISDLKDRIPNQLSGGQCQRVAIGRAMVKSPKMILADEPTGNLDHQSGLVMMDIFKSLSKDKLVIVVTHDREIAERLGDRVIEISDGRVVKDLKKEDQLISENVEIVGGTLLKVPKNSEIPEKVLSQVNEILYSNDRDSYLIREENIQKVKSLNQHIKGAVEINPENKETYFTQYRPVPSKEEAIVFKPIKMPMLSSAKIALSTFKYKKLKLILTIMMLTTALFMCCYIANFSLYNKNLGIAKSIVADNIAGYTIRKNTKYSRDSVFREEEILQLKKHTKSYAKGYRMSLQILSQKDGSLAIVSSDTIKSEFEGFYEAESIAEFGFQFIAGTMPKQHEMYGVAITKFMFEELLTMDYFKDIPKNSVYSDYIGEKITLGLDTFFITGITDNRGADEGLTRLRSGYFYGNDYRGIMASLDVDNVLSMMFCNPDLMNYLKEHKKFYNTKFSSFINESTTFNISSITTKERFEDAQYYTLSGEHKPDAIYISDVDYSALFKNAPSPIDANNQLTDAAIANLISYNAKGVDGALELAVTDTKVAHIFNDIEIAGVFTSVMSNLPVGHPDRWFVNNLVVVNEDIFTKVASGQSDNNALLIATSKSVGENRKLLEYLDKNGYSPYTTAAVPYADSVFLDPFYSTLFVVFMLLFMTFSAVLMYNFIKNSIKMESKQIGILRGLGARGIDTFKIFAIEGALMTLISLIISMCIFIILTVVSANTYYAKMGYHFYSYLFSPAIPFILIALGVIITTCGTSIPLFKLQKMTPMDAMYKPETPKS